MYYRSETDRKPTISVTSFKSSESGYTSFSIHRSYSNRHWTALRAALLLCSVVVVEIHRTRSSERPPSLDADWSAQPSATQKRGVGIATVKRGRSVRGVLPVYWIFDSTYRNAHTTYGTQRCQRFPAACNKDFFSTLKFTYSFMPCVKSILWYDPSVSVHSFTAWISHYYDKY